MVSSSSHSLYVTLRRSGPSSAQGHIVSFSGYTAALLRCGTCSTSQTQDVNNQLQKRGQYQMTRQH